MDRWSPTLLDRSMKFTMFEIARFGVPSREFPQLLEKHVGTITRWLNRGLA